jgi:hypothetical protein
VFSASDTGIYRFAECQKMEIIRIVHNNQFVQIAVNALGRQKVVLELIGILNANETYRPFGRWQIIRNLWIAAICRLINFRVHLLAATKWFAIR